MKNYEHYAREELKLELNERDRKDYEAWKQRRADALDSLIEETKVTYWYKEMLANLTSTQARCTELLEENRRLKLQLKDKC